MSDGNGFLWGLAFAASIVLGVLKVAGVLAISWWLVAAPLLLVLALALLGLLILVVVFIVGLVLTD